MKYVDGLYVVETEKAWATQSVLRKYLEKVVPLLERGERRALLVWDSASTHRALDMKQYLARRRIDQVMIPAGCTGYLQSLDLVINKPFKNYVHDEINAFIENRQVRNARGNLVKPSSAEVSGWIGRSWSKISREMVNNALIAAYLSSNHSFEESMAAKHERLGPLIRACIDENAIIEDIGEVECEESDDYFIIVSDFENSSIEDNEESNECFLIESDSENE
jgi:hypothetical protein